MIKNILSIKGVILIGFFFLTFACYSQQQSFTINELLRIVKPEQPRLLYTFELQERLDSMMLNDSTSGKELKKLLMEAERIVDLPVVDYERGIDSAAKDFFNRIIALSFAARHTGRKQFFVKLTKELDKAVMLEDWNSKNFPTLSLMTMGVAIGYDWLHTSLNGETKKKYNEAIYNKGLKYGLIEYEKMRPGQKVQPDDWVLKATALSVHNNCGMLIGALSIARDFPQASANTILYASNSLSNALRNFPLSIVQDINEFSTINLFLTVSSLQFALNKDFGLSKSLGFRLITDSFNESDKGTMDGQQKFINDFIVKNTSQ